MGGDLSPADYDLPAIEAAILVGGLGTRLRGVLDDRPKPLAPIAGRPMLAYLLDQLAAAGIGSAVLCTGYRGQLIEQALGDRHGPMRLRYSLEASPLGTGGALRLAAPSLASALTLVLNGDSYCAADLPRFCNDAARYAAPATMLLTHVADVGRFGQAHVDAGGRICRFDEKGAAAGPGWINAGLYLLARSLLLTIPAGSTVSLERECFPAWAHQGLLYGQQQTARFLDIGTPESLAAAEAFFNPVDDS